jgi:integrase
MSARRSSKITRGNSHLTVYPWTHPATGSLRWRFAFQDGGTTKYRTFKKKAAAEAAAARILDEAPAGLVWSGLLPAEQEFLTQIHRRTQPEDWPAALAYLAARSKSSSMGAAVADYKSFKTAGSGEITPHLRQAFSNLDRLAGDFPGRRLAEIHSAELLVWVETRTAGRSAKTCHEIRGHLVGFWRWALKQGIAGSDPITPAEKLPTHKIHAGERRILTPTELQAVMAAVEPEWRAWVVLGAFGGLRPEEIAPQGQRIHGKRGLDCSEIDFTFKVIRLPACVSKVKRPRIIPMSEALLAGLKWAGIEAGMTGPTTLRNPAGARELTRLGKLLFGGTWPQDVLRHSYGSYRNAVLRSLDQVAEEMGTSVTMLHRHYHNPQHADLGTAWFAIRPPDSNGSDCSVNDPLKTPSPLEHSQGSHSGPIEISA